MCSCLSELEQIYRDFSCSLNSCSFAAIRGKIILKRLKCYNHPYMDEKTNDSNHGCQDILGHVFIHLKLCYLSGESLRCWASSDSELSGFKIKHNGWQNMTSVDYWIQKLGLERHPEGGYFKETYRSSEVILKHALPARLRRSIFAGYASHKFSDI